MAKKEVGGRSQQQNDFLEPLAPISIVATDVGTNRPYNNGAASVSFSLPTNSPPATSYTVYSTIGGYSATGSSSPIIITGLPTPDSGTMQFYVIATNASGNSPASSNSSAISITGVPATMSAPSATSTSALQDVVSWTAPATGGKSIVNYYWESSDAKSGNTTSTSVTVTQEGGTSQTYKVRAENANGLGIWSADSGSVTTVSPFFPFFPPYFPPFFPPFFPFFPYFPPFFPYFPPFFPFFPPFFPFFPYFPPFFPYFPPFFPFFPPFFPPRFPFFPPFFPPRFPFFPPFFPPRFPRFTATAQIGSAEILILSDEFGYLSPNYLEEGDLIKSFIIDGFSNNYEFRSMSINLRESDTHIISIDNDGTQVGVVSINEEFYSANCYLLVRKDNVYQFIVASEIDASCEIFNVKSQEFIEITSVNHENYLIDNVRIVCEPNMLFVIQSALGYIG